MIDSSVSCRSTLYEVSWTGSMNAPEVPNRRLREIVWREAYNDKPFIPPFCGPFDFAMLLGWTSTALYMDHLIRPTRPHSESDRQSDEPDEADTAPIKRRRFEE
ncbi:hypothetical protein NW762_011199 [Fusarium torreyae]|uniref:Uncharacterized protein n=1 Tax=Fusarium torreyae TaxID=1237075 RepID=A0A9W8RPX5_9HYPO|nr:hypothetical protein NW762_011199 [Fusarium torreyae]